VGDRRVVVGVGMGRKLVLEVASVPQVVGDVHVLTTGQGHVNAWATPEEQKGDYSPSPPSPPSLSPPS
jgi:hypothetical protein